MDNLLDHNNHSLCAGHDGVHLCHRCGWPFPNPHPSSKHRRAHKRVCGTIQGYNIVILQSESDGDHYLVVSDDSDDNEHNPPSPVVEKRNVKELVYASGGIGANSNKSDDDVFSDAITEFSDGGISPQLKDNKSIVEGDSSDTQSKMIDQSIDRAEQLKDPTSDQMCNSTLLVTPMDQSDSAAVVATARVEDEPVPIGHSNCLQPDLIKSEIPRDAAVDSVHELSGGELEQRPALAGTKEDIQKEDDKLSSVVLDSEVIENDPSPLAETLENMGATTEVKGMGDHLAEETHANVNNSVELLEVSDSVEVTECPVAIHENNLAKESHSSLSSAKPDETKNVIVFTDSAVIECSDVVSNVSSIDQDVNKGNILDGSENTGNFDPSDGTDSSIIGNENKNQGPKDRVLEELVSDHGHADNSENDKCTGALEEDVNHYEKADTALLKSGSKEGEGAAVVTDSAMRSVNATDFPSSLDVVSDAGPLKSESISGSGFLKAEDNGTHNLLLESDINGTAEVPCKLGSAGPNAGNYDTSDVQDTNAPKTPLEDLISLTETPGPPLEVTRDNVDETPSDLKHKGGSEQLISKEVAPSSTEIEILSQTSDIEHSTKSNDSRSSECNGAAKEGVELNGDDNIVVPSENLRKPTEEMLEALNESQASSQESSKPVHIASGLEQTCEPNAATPVLNEPVPSFCFQVTNGNSASGTDNGKNLTVDSKSLVDEGDVKLTKVNDGISAMDVTGSPISRSDSLEGKCGSVSDKSENFSQETKTKTEQGCHEKSDVFEPPSFMTLVQSEGKLDQSAAASEIETIPNNQQAKSDHALQTGWFPSLTNVVNESEGRKKNEEIIGKVKNWNQGKQHGPLKTLLSDAKSPNTKQMSATYNKDDAAVKDNGATGSTINATHDSEAPKDEAANKEAEKEWDSPARYPIETKKEKKKGKPYWVPFVCCSSVHRDL